MCVPQTRRAQQAANHKRQGARAARHNPIPHYRTPVKPPSAPSSRTLRSHPAVGGHPIMRVMPRRTRSSLGRSPPLRFGPLVSLSEDHSKGQPRPAVIWSCSAVLHTIGACHSPRAKQGAGPVPSASGKGPSGLRAGNVEASSMSGALHVYTAGRPPFRRRSPALRPRDLSEEF